MITVNVEAIDRTTECKKYFACLRGHFYRVCAVKPHEQTGKLVCADEAKCGSCNYRKYHNRSNTCTCLVRKELHNRHYL
jgi:hypothetical protein